MNPIGIKISNSLLDVMQDGREFESLLGYQYNNLDVLREIRRSISEIYAVEIILLYVMLQM